MTPPPPRGQFDRNERVLVIGLGRSGRATVDVLRERVHSVVSTDEAPREELADALHELERKSVRFVEPRAIADVLPSVTVAVLSPGIPLNAPLVRAVQAANVPVFSEVEVAYRICRAPIVAVTGTKGKTTTTALLGALFRAAGKTVRVGGNIGNALIGETANAEPGDWVVAEVSSFQLESIRSFKPRVSLILNITPDHLDRYPSMEEYAEAKFRIFANQGVGDTFVGNLDDPIVASAQQAQDDDDGPRSDRIKARALWFAGEPHRQTTLYLRRGETIVYAPPTGDPRPIDVMRVDEIPLLGRHNVENVMAAILVGLAAGLELDAIREGVRTFRALPHRLEPVAEVDGVRYVDDSKATNPGSVIAAMRSFDRPIVLIAGGKAKGTDFAEMGKVVSSRAKAVVLIGEAADEIAGVVRRAKVERASSIEDAVRRAADLAEPGDVVLLSPGCSSFDMFRSAEHRGEAFADAVHTLEKPFARAR